MSVGAALNLPLEPVRQVLLAPLAPKMSLQTVVERAASVRPGTKFPPEGGEEQVNPVGRLSCLRGLAMKMR
jgi:hypothetical protein